MTKRQTSCKLAEQVGARIRFLRLELGLSLKGLGKRAQMHASMPHGIEMGRTSTRVDTLRRIARALHVEPFELLNHDTENDDVAYVVEKMRVDEGVAEVVRGRLNRLTEQGKGAHALGPGIALAACPDVPGARSA